MSENDRNSNSTGIRHCAIAGLSFHTTVKKFDDAACHGHSTHI